MQSQTARAADTAQHHRNPPSWVSWFSQYTTVSVTAGWPASDPLTGHPEPQKCHKLRYLGLEITPRGAVDTGSRLSSSEGADNLIPVVKRKQSSAGAQQTGCQDRCILFPGFHSTVGRGQQRRLDATEPSSHLIVQSSRRCFTSFQRMAGTSLRSVFLF